MNTQGEAGSFRKVRLWAAGTVTRTPAPLLLGHSCDADLNAAQSGRNIVNIAHHTNEFTSSLCHACSCSYSQSCIVNSSGEIVKRPAVGIVLISKNLETSGQGSCPCNPASKCPEASIQSIRPLPRNHAIQSGRSHHRIERNLRMPGQAGGAKA